MTVLKRRTRMVNFRLSEDEYKELKNLCIANGSRSISDFARAAVCQSLGSNGSAEKFEGTVRELHGKFAELDREVKRLAQLLAEAGSPVIPKKNAVSSPGEGGVGSRKAINGEKLCGSVS